MSAYAPWLILVFIIIAALTVYQWITTASRITRVVKQALEQQDFVTSISTTANLAGKIERIEIVFEEGISNKERDRARKEISEMLLRPMTDYRNTTQPGE